MSADPCWYLLQDYRLGQDVSVDGTWWLLNFQIDSIVADLQNIYPSQKESVEWVNQLTEMSDIYSAKALGFPHIAETVIKPMTRGAELVRQILIAITHSYDAFG